MSAHSLRPQTHAPVTDRKVRFALVGCGRIAANHIEAIKAHAERAELVAVCDTDPAKLAGGRRAHRRARLSRASRRCWPPRRRLRHPHHAQRPALRSRRSQVAARRPPRHDRKADGDALAGRPGAWCAPATTAGVRLFVVKQNRRNATLQLLKRRSTQGRFGRIYMVNVNVFWTRPQEYYDSAAWRGTWEFDGGAFMNQASHYVDLLDWLDRPGRERAGLHRARWRATSRSRTPASPRCAGATARWASMNVTMLTYPKNLEGSITILGEKGTVRDRRRGRQRDPALGVRRHARDGRRRSTTPATRRPRSTASAIRCTTTTSSRCCAARPSPRPTAARA